MSAGYYKHHVFICTHERAQYSACGDFETQSVRSYMKATLENRGLHGEGKVRISPSGCLGRCLSGPVIVVYPEGTWYTFVDNLDIDEIIDSHLIENRVVSRLLIDQK